MATRVTFNMDTRFLPINIILLLNIRIRVWALTPITTTDHFLNQVEKKGKRRGKRRKSHIQYRTDNAIILITINQSPLNTRSGARIMTSCGTGIYSVISCKLSGVPRGVFFFFFFGPFTHYPSSSSSSS